MRRTNSVKHICAVFAFVFAMMGLSKATFGVDVTVRPGSNPTVTLNIPSPGTPDSIHVSPASGYAFSQGPAIYNNPTGLWWDAGGNTFSVVFLAGGAISADVMITGKLKPVGGGGGGGSGKPPEYDFSLPGLAVLVNEVGAVFELPDETWVLEGRGVPCRVRFFSNSGSVTSVTSNYAWDGDVLGIFGSSTFENQRLSFGSTTEQGTFSKQGRVKGSFTNIKVDGAGNSSTEVYSIDQKVFKAEFNALTIIKQREPTYELNAQTGSYVLTCTAVLFGKVKFTPQPDVAVSLRLPQTVSTYAENEFDCSVYLTENKKVWCTTSGVQRFDTFYGEGDDLWEPGQDGIRFLRGEDIPFHPVASVLSSYVSAYRADQFVVLVQAAIQDLWFTTYGKNTWAWSATHTKGSLSVVTKFFSPDPESDGAAANDDTPATTPSVRDVATNRYIKCP